MTENKRFTITQDFEEHYKQIRDNGHIIMGCFVEQQAEVIVNLLNEQHEQIERLKGNFRALDEVKCELADENEQLKQFKEKVFALIDKEIARNEEAIKWEKETIADSGSIEVYNYMLNRLKKELQEMTENKRFTMCHEQNDINGWTMSIVDWETKEPFNYTTYEVHSSSITDTRDEMEDLCLLLNELNDENQELKQELHKIYELATVDKVRDIVENVYDDLLYKTSDESDYARTKVLKCLEDIDNLRDDLE